MISRIKNPPDTLPCRSSTRNCRGDYEQDLSALSGGRFRSEISELAAAIEESGRAHIREKQLTERVEALEVRIDRKQREEDVCTISETEFFKDLQLKAHDMRDSKPEDD